MTPVRWHTLAAAAGYFGAGAGLDAWSVSIGQFLDTLRVGQRPPVGTKRLPAGAAKHLTRSPRPHERWVCVMPEPVTGRTELQRAFRTGVVERREALRRSRCTLSARATCCCLQLRVTRDIDALFSADGPYARSIRGVR